MNVEHFEQEIASISRKLEKGGLFLYIEVLQRNGIILRLKCTTLITKFYTDTEDPYFVAVGPFGEVIFTIDMVKEKQNFTLNDEKRTPIIMLTLRDY